MRTTPQRVREIGLALAEQPYVTGAQSENGEVAIVTVGNRRGALGVGTLDAAGLSRDTDSIVRSLRNTDHIDGSKFVVVAGRGEETRDLVADFASALEQAFPDTEVYAAAVIDDQYQVVNDDLWTNPLPLPSIDADMVARGHQPPAASLNDYAERYAPTSKPTFDQLSALHTARLDRQPPTMRAEVGERALDVLAESKVDDPMRQALVAHLANDDVYVRDRLIVHALTSPAHTSAMVRTYRGAPEQQRAGVAVVAASAGYLSQRVPPVGVDTMLKHSDPTASLTQLVRDCRTFGVMPNAIADNLRQEVLDKGPEADAKWVARKAGQHEMYPQGSVGQDGTSSPAASPHRPNRRAAGPELSA